MITKSTPELLQFYKDWLAAAEAPDADDNCHPIFHNGVGLCRNLGRWCDEFYDYLTYDNAYSYMQWQFVDAGLDRVYPFGEKNYDLACINDIQHKDEKRLMWVRARIADMEEK